MYRILPFYTSRENPKIVLTHFAVENFEKQGVGYIEVI